jgi:hypothetical protein
MHSIEFFGAGSGGECSRRAKTVCDGARHGLRMRDRPHVPGVRKNHQPCLRNEFCEHLNDL